MKKPESPYLSKNWFERPSPEVAPDLIGCKLIRYIHKIKIESIIVETEAYSINDPACHAYRRRSKRNQVMFGEPGYLYIFKIYGIHHCLNLVTDLENTPSAVLIRAVEFTKGLDSILIEKDRTYRAGSGPGKLCKILNIDLAMNGMPLNNRKSILIEKRTDEMNRELESGRKNIVQTTRIGITKGMEIPWRFYLQESRSVSVRVPKERTHSRF